MSVRDEEEWRDVFGDQQVDEWNAEESRRVRHARALDVIRAQHDKDERSYNRRYIASMVGRGIIGAYLLGLVLSLGELNPLDWPPLAGICAVCALLGWILTMERP